MTRSIALSLQDPPSPSPSAAAVHLSSSSSKLPFRPRKIRKITATTKDAASKSTTATVTLTPAISPTVIKLKPLSTEGEIDAALNHLRSSDPILATLIDSNTRPNFESSKPPFISLTRSIIFQQLATNAARSIYTRFLNLCGGEGKIQPDAVLALSASQLREIGVSGRKASYLHDLAEKFREGSLSDSAILEMEEEEMVERLTAVKGIGVWSVHMFMIFSMHKPDVLPVGDLGVRKGVQGLYGLKGLPEAGEMENVCEKWRPYRSVGAWYMWRLVEAKAAAGKAAKKVKIKKVVVAAAADADADADAIVTNSK
ncbi:DNA-3-methyladenine glycosylase 1 [Linum perenne]